MNSSHWTMMSLKLLRYASFAVKWRTEYFRYCEIFEDSCFQVYHQYFALRIIRVINSKFTVKTFFFFNSIVLLGTVLHATRNDKVVFSWELISSHSREQSRLYSPLKKKRDGYWLTFHDVMLSRLIHLQFQQQNYWRHQVGMMRMLRTHNVNVYVVNP